MAERGLKFRHVVIDAEPPGWKHDITLIGDLTGNGANDIVIGGKEGEVNLFWYENPLGAGGDPKTDRWPRHEMAHAPELEAGGILLDVNRDGRLDIVAGQQIGGNELYWFECPADPRKRWRRRVIEDRFRKYHDQLAADVDGDGEPEIVVLSQKAGVLCYYDVPADPTVEPWPRECCHVVAEDMHDVEGLAAADIEADGELELIVGPNVFRPAREWQRTPFAQGFDKTRVAAADLDADGLTEIVICEGESHPGRLAICHLPELEPKILRDDLFHPHSLAIADFTGDGHPDIFVAEMGLGKNPEPRMMIYRNRGPGEFDEVVIERGIATHEAKLGDLTGDGRPDIVGKPYDPERHIDVWFNETNG